jgi:hypothetical protein
LVVTVACSARRAALDERGRGVGDVDRRDREVAERAAHHGHVGRGRVVTGAHGERSDPAAVLDGLHAARAHVDERDLDDDVGEQPVEGQLERDLPGGGPRVHRDVRLAEHLPAGDRARHRADAIDRERRLVGGRRHDLGREGNADAPAPRGGDRLGPVHAGQQQGKGRERPEE